MPTQVFLLAPSQEASNILIYMAIVQFRCNINELDIFKCHNIHQRPDIFSIENVPLLSVIRDLQLIVI